MKLLAIAAHGVKERRDLGPAFLLRPRGLEPPTFAAAVRRSNPLSYGRMRASLKRVGVSLRKTPALLRLEPTGLQ